MRSIDRDFIERCIRVVIVAVLGFAVVLWGYFSTGTHEAMALREVLFNIDSVSVFEVFDKEANGVCLKNITNLTVAKHSDEMSILTQDRLANMDKANLSVADTELLLNVVEDYFGDSFGVDVDDETLAALRTHVNFANTATARAAYESTGFQYKKNFVGFYMPTTKDIYIDVPRNLTMTDVLATLVHESFHFVSDGGLNMRISDRISGKGYTVHRNVNEGVTEMYAMRGMRELGFCYGSSAYPRQVEVMRAFEAAVGADVLREAYLSGKTNELREHFNAAFETNVNPVKSAFSETFKLDKYEAFNLALDAYVEAGSLDYLSKRNHVYALIEQYKQQIRNQ